MVVRKGEKMKDKKTLIDILGDIMREIKLLVIPEIFLRPTAKILKGRSHLIGVEIGVHYGNNARAMLSSLSIDTLYLIDPYLPYYEKGRIRVIDDIEKAMHSRLRSFRRQCRFIKKTSSEAVDDVPNNLDFVYIDGNHSHPYVDDDIQLYYPKVKPGGVLGGHDYHNDWQEVMEAVDSFVQKNGLKLFHSEADWWIIK